MRSNSSDKAKIWLLHRKYEIKKRGFYQMVKTHDKESVEFTSLTH
jgi:hypothetical protein